MNGSNESASTPPPQSPVQQHQQQQQQQQQYAAQTPPPPPPQGLIFTSTVAGQLPSLQQPTQMWAQQQAPNMPPQPRPAIFLTNLTGGVHQAQMPMANSGTSLIFASPSPDGTGLIRAPVPTVATSQLGNPLNGPTSPFVMTVNSTPGDALSSTSTSIAVSGNSGIFNGGISTITSSQSSSVVLDQPQTTMQLHKVVSLATVPSTPIVGNETPLSSVTQQTISIPASVFSSKSLTDLVKETDPHLQLDEDTEEIIMSLSEEFIETVADKAIRMATHRGSSVVEAKDIKFCLDHDWNIFVPGFPSTERTWKRPFVLHAHKQRLAIAKKQIKRT